ncbi:13013_t:CDS:2 [Rhizophagus irregularis]|nr:13013_t:CDS:2 [Rhizophagus irregularis]
MFKQILQKFMPRYVPKLEKCNQTPQEDDDNYISDNIRPIKKSKTTSTTSKQKATQDIEAIITNLTTNGARNYNNVVFTFPNGGSIGAWKQQINANIPWYES